MFPQHLLHRAVYHAVHSRLADVLEPISFGRGADSTGWQGRFDRLVHRFAYRMGDVDNQISPYQRTGRLNSSFHIVAGPFHLLGPVPLCASQVASGDIPRRSVAAPPCPNDDSHHIYVSEAVTPEKLGSLSDVDINSAVDANLVFPGHSGCGREILVSSPFRRPSRSVGFFGWSVGCFPTIRLVLGLLGRRFGLSGRFWRVGCVGCGGPRLCLAFLFVRLVWGGRACEVSEILSE